MKCGVKYMMNDGMKRFTFRISQDLHTALKEEAEKMNVSLNALILQILREWLEKQEKTTT